MKLRAKIGKLSMTLFDAIISGIVQGITEFLPISSSGHLVILHRLIGLKEPQIFFDIFLHMGTLLAILIVFWEDIVYILTAERRMLFYILLATFSTAIFVLIFRHRIESAFTNVKFVGSMLILTGFWLFLGNFVRFGSRGFRGFKVVLIGLVQGISAIPGISRSGATISTSLFLGLDVKHSARFSFLLSVPAVIGAFVLKIKDLDFSDFGGRYLAGLIISCIVGVFSLKLLLKVLYKNRLHLFGVYCIALGILVVIFL